MYWDGESTPSLEVPVGDFFGLGLAEYFLYESELLSVGSQRSLNSFFPMPFRRSAKITVTNEGEEKVKAFYYNIDYEKHESLPDDLAYFHAQYRQAAPNKSWTAEWAKNSDELVNTKQNLDGKDNYVIMDAEDYYLGAWCYGGCGISPFGNQRPTFAYQRYGNPKNGGDDRGAKWMVYRFHSESPIAFTESIKVTIEHGHGNHRADNYYTVAYWYQSEPHKPFPTLPSLQERIPRQFDTGGPTTGKP